VSGEAAADFEFRQDGNQIVFVPALVGIAEDEIKGAFKPGHQLVGIGQAGVYVLAEASFFEIGQRFSVAPLVDIDGDELAAGLAQRPSHPDCGMAGGGANLQSAGIVVFDDEVVQHLAIR